MLQLLRIIKALVFPIWEYHIHSISVLAFIQWNIPVEHSKLFVIRTMLDQFWQCGKWIFEGFFEVKGLYQNVFKFGGSIQTLIGGAPATYYFLKCSHLRLKLLQGLALSQNKQEEKTDSRGYTH